MENLKFTSKRDILAAITKIATISNYFPILW